MGKKKKQKKRQKRNRQNRKPDLMEQLDEFEKSQKKRRGLQELADEIQAEMSDEFNSVVKESMSSLIKSLIAERMTAQHYGQHIVDAVRRMQREGKTSLEILHALPIPAEEKAKFISNYEEVPNDPPCPDGLNGRHCLCWQNGTASCCHCGLESPEENDPIRRQYD